MTVYVLVEVDIDGDSIVGVFATPEAAKKILPGVTNWEPCRGCCGWTEGEHCWFGSRQVRKFTGMRTDNYEIREYPVEDS